MISRRLRRVGVALVAALTSGTVPVGAAAPVPGTSCEVFPESNIWNTKIAELPVHPMSDT